MKEEIKKKLTEYIKSEKGLFFTDVEWFFKEQGYDFKGEKCIFLINDNGTPNYSQVVWADWSEEAVDMICEIINESNGKIGLRVSTDPIMIMLGGGGLNLPISHNFEYTYKKPHWAPGTIEYLGGKQKC